MAFDWEKAKEKYRNVTIPDDLDQVVNQAIERAKKENVQDVPGEQNEFAQHTMQTSKKVKKSHRRLYTIGGIAASVSIAFVIGVNTSVAFAQSVSNLPVLGQIAKVVMTDQIKEEVEASKTDVKIPSVVGLSDAEFEKRVNEQIQTRVKAHVADIQKQADELIQARIETGTDASEAGQVNIIGDYEVYYQGDDKVSFKIDVFSDQGASGWNEVYLYNLDVVHNKELKLSDLFKNDSYISIITDEVKRQMKQRMQDENVSFWIQQEDYDMGMGFEEIQANQTFHFNKAGELVIYFEKYEVAPGYMGAQEFVIPQDLIQDIWK